MNILIGLSGKPRSGKDTVAAYLEETYGFYRYAFADYLKWIAYNYFKMEKDVLWGKKTDESRKFLQRMGKFLTDLDSDFFISNVVEKMRKDYYTCVEQDRPYCAVISDVRRHQELKLFDRSSTAFLLVSTLSDSGVSLTSVFEKILVVKIDRPTEVILKEEPGLSENINHSIESFPDTFKNWDYYIHNTSSLDRLHSSIDLMLYEINGEAFNDTDKRESV